MTPRIAIVCSGLGNVARGNETWAANLAEALHKSGGNIILFGSGPAAVARAPYVRVPCWQRDGWLRRFLSWDKMYLYEQISFARNFRRHLRPDRFDIVHACDPNLAQQLIRHCERQNLALIYKDSLFIGPHWCAKFKHVQALAPYYLELARNENVDTAGWKTITQFVNVKIFAPANSKAALRQELFRGALPRDASVVLAVGDFSPHSNKRLDWIITEIAAAKSQPHLILAGHGEGNEVAAIRALAEQTLPGRAHILVQLPHAEMPKLFQCADLFVHAATREPFGLVLIEAMASGLPVLAHPFPVTQWIIGNGGLTIDMTKQGELAQSVDHLIRNPAERNALAQRGLDRARSVFARDAILPQYHQWYNELAQRQARS